MAKKLNSFEGLVYSTDPDWQPEVDNQEDMPTLPKDKQKLLVAMERKQRGGKTATLITGFAGSPTDLEALCKMLKTKCGTGGSAKDNEIIIQGDMREKILAILLQEGYGAKRGN